MNRERLDIYPSPGWAEGKLNFETENGLGNADLAVEMGGGGFSP